MGLSTAAPISTPLASTSSSGTKPALTAEQLAQPTTRLFQWYNPPSPTSPEAHAPRFGKERAALDWAYHVLPKMERQEVQDRLVEDELRRAREECESGQEASRAGEKSVKGKQRALFTAGAMGAGKGHTLRAYLKEGVITLPRDYIWVDPDALAQKIPERGQYLAASMPAASGLLHPEASLLAEILAGVAFNQRRSMVMDGSLSDCGWFGHFMKKYSDADYELEILFVFATERIMLERAERRAKLTGRVTDPSHILSSRLRSSRCVTSLASPSHVGRVRIVDNSVDGVFPRLVYDSALDQGWKEGAGVDVEAFMDGRKEQAPLEEGGRPRDKKQTNGRL